MVLVVLLTLVAAVIVAGAVYQARLRRSLPHDLRGASTEGLPSEAAIRSGELGHSAAALSRPGSENPS